MTDLSKIPDEDLKREFMRRFNATRKRAGGRPPVLKPCVYCGQQFGFEDMRRHVPECKRNILAKPVRALVGLTVAKEQWQKIVPLGKKGKKNGKA